MHLRITTPEGTFFEEVVDGFHLETHKGERTILDNHVNYLCFFEYTPVMLLDEKGDTTFYLYSGYAQLIDDQVVVICQKAAKEDFSGTLFEREVS